MAPVQEANIDNFGILFLIVYTIMYVECTYYNRLIEAILMSTHNIQFHDK